MINVWYGIITRFGRTENKFQGEMKTGVGRPMLHIYIYVCGQLSARYMCVGDRETLCIDSG